MIPERVSGISKHITEILSLKIIRYAVKLAIICQGWIKIKKLHHSIGFFPGYIRIPCVHYQRGIMRFLKYCDLIPPPVFSKMIAMITEKDDQPFFLAVGLAKPHDPFIAPKKYFDLYPIEDCVPPQIPDGWEPPYPHTLPGETGTFNKFTDQERMEFLRSYYACTSFMDAQLGKIMNTLDEEGLMENTLIVFFGDHGYHLGEHGWWNKVTVFQKSHNAPLIVYTG
ncbi:MAG TPA: DUF229 domain-containing protein, partial [Bacteroides sp.]|nr:DUF229 domain-containing protein [Bacteroides sp.]